MLPDLTRAPSGPQLSSDAFFGDSAGNIWVHSHSSGDSYTYRMPNTVEVLEVAHGDVWSGFASPNGATYLASSTKWPLWRFFEGKFEVLPLITDTSAAVLHGIGGKDPDADRLALVTCPDHRRGAKCELSYGAPSAMKKVALGVVGTPAGVTFGDGEDEIWVGLQAFNSKSQPALLRVSGGRVEHVSLPSKAGKSADVCGLARTAQGDLLVMLGDRVKEDAPAKPWLRRRNGRWEELPVKGKLVGWLGRFDCLAHRGKVYIPSERGVFSYDGKALQKESKFNAISLWPCGEHIVARGWRDGVSAHEILRDGVWQPFSVPEPDVVFGGFGKVVYLTKRNKLPLRRVRLPLPKPRSAPIRPSKGIEYATFLQELSKRKGAKKRSRAIDLAARVAGDIGHAISPELEQYLAVVSSHRLGESGLWFHLDPEGDGFIDTSGSPERFVDTTFQYGENAQVLLTDTLSIGQDGSGNAYCVELAPKSSRVYFFDHDTNMLEPLADSLSTFAELNDIFQSWSDLEEAEGVDIEDYDAKSPAFQAIRARAKALAGRVHACGDYTDTLDVLAGKKLRLRERDTTLKLSEARHWLSLTFLIERASRSRAVKAGGKVRGLEVPGTASTTIYWLLHHFLLGNEAELGELIKKQNGSKVSASVKKTIELVQAASGKQKAKSKLAWFAGLRGAVEP
ncbi:MAG TPA: SMI1/KNR4 family protein [Polyangiaceae bacterium]|nr:SMI1/KNR4 family protein [Polyangiaceae bacterium]